MIPKSGFAFVQFENEQAANDAISNESGKMYYGRKIGMIEFNICSDKIFCYK